MRSCTSPWERSGASCDAPTRTRCIQSVRKCVPASPTNHESISLNNGSALRLWVSFGLNRLGAGLLPSSRYKLDCACVSGKGIKGACGHAANRFSIFGSLSVPCRPGPKPPSPSVLTNKRNRKRMRRRGGRRPRKRDDENGATDGNGRWSDTKERKRDRGTNPTQGSTRARRGRKKHHSPAHTHTHIHAHQAPPTTAAKQAPATKQRRRQTNPSATHPTARTKRQPGGGPPPAPPTPKPPSRAQKQGGPTIRRRVRVTARRGRQAAHHRVTHGMRAPVIATTCINVCADAASNEIRYMPSR